jgi:hypothetical protein
VLDGSAGQVGGVLAASGGAAGQLGWWIEWGESAAYAERAEFGVECGDGVGDLFAGVLVSGGAAVGVGGDEVGSGGHQCFLVFGGGGPLGERFGVEVPALAALDHP